MKKLLVFVARVGLLWMVYMAATAVESTLRFPLGGS